MKTETLEIKTESAITAHENAKGSGKKLLEDLFGKKIFQKDVKERIKTFLDVLNALGNADEDVRQYKKLYGVFLDNKNHILNYHRATLVAKALNEGWEPNFGDFDERKYYAWFSFERNSDKSSGFGFSFDAWTDSRAATSVGARLCFKSSELAGYAGSQFEDLYKNFLTLNK